MNKCPPQAKCDGCTCEKASREFDDEKNIAETLESIMEFRTKIYLAMIGEKFKGSPDKLEELSELHRATEYYMDAAARGSLLPEIIEDLINQAKERFGL